MILAIDTSTDTASIAVLRDGAPVSEVSWAAPTNHSRHAASAIRRAMELGALEPADLTAIAVAIGPGSFNGVRVGLSLAKGMAMALDIPLVGIPTLDAIAFQAVVASRRVWATVPAGRGEICIAGYSADGGLGRETGYLRLLVANAARICSPGDLAAGPARHQLASAAGELGVPLAVEPAVRDVRRSSYLAELGRRYIDAGGKSQLHDVEPLYLRRPAAEETRAQRAQE